VTEHTRSPSKGVALVSPAGAADQYGNLVRQGADPNSGLPLEAVLPEVGMPMVLCPAGEFMMGSARGDEDACDKEKPRHRVRIAQDFYIGKYQVTQGEWAAVASDKPWSGEGRATDGERHAASYINWDATRQFLQRLTNSTGLDCRLPTEAEWEYACRAGLTSTWCFGDDVSQFGDYAWFCGNAYGVGEEYAHDVGLKKANAWGLHDMHGNVWEWCEDWYDERYYANSPIGNPTGPDSDESRVLRGGSWYDDASSSRCACRRGRDPTYRGSGFKGLRVVVSAPSPE